MIIMPAMRGLFRKSAPVISHPDPSVWFKFQDGAAKVDSGTLGLTWTNGDSLTLSNDIPNNAPAGGLSADFSLASTDTLLFSDTADIADIDLSTIPFTIEFWAKNTSGGYEEIVHIKYNSNQTGSILYFYYLSSERLRLAFDWGGDGYFFDGYDLGLDLSVWRHICVVKEQANPASVLIVYIDGVKYATGKTARTGLPIKSIFVGSSSITAPAVGIGSKVYDLRMYFGYAKYTSGFTPGFLPS